MSYPGGGLNTQLYQSWRETWLLVAALIAGALNAIAGGGSLLSFPALLGTAIPPIQANATNTVALWPGQFTSIAGYFSHLRANLRLVPTICSAALVGGLSGAIILMRTGQATFMFLVPWLLLFAATLFAVSGPVARRLQNAASTVSEERKPARIPLWFAVATISFYIGYFGAGAGFLLMAVLIVLGIENIHQVNALKVIATTTANGIAVLTFIAKKQIHWQYCLPMMIAAAIGGYLGAHYSRKLNPDLVRLVVVLIGFGMAAYFFWMQYA